MFKIILLIALLLIGPIFVENQLYADPPQRIWYSGMEISQDGARLIPSNGDGSGPQIVDGYETDGSGPRHRTGLPVRPRPVTIPVQQRARSTIYSTGVMITHCRTNLFEARQALERNDLQGCERALNTATENIWILQNMCANGIGPREFIVNYKNLVRDLQLAQFRVLERSASTHITGG